MALLVEINAFETHALLDVPNHLLALYVSGSDFQEKLLRVLLGTEV